MWVLLGCGLWVCVVEVFAFLLRLWFVLGRFLEFGYGFVWIEVDSAMAMVSWVLAWWVRSLCFVARSRRLSLNGVLYFLEEMGLVGFCFVGPPWLWPVGLCS